ncbi:hypothetical protein H1P_760028 [Hyella patelloides LEGE 07179]|uniref:Uncharacterized protein n=1 Tax=Hyella patelloides LEGE 07179 TaxID=945734 RepID=A0A563W3U9_9CYAN|nr:hypothetical protein H1P_760028 [Hyella patelloides LEGE 07179]
MFSAYFGNLIAFFSIFNLQKTGNNTNQIFVRVKKDCPIIPGAMYVAIVTPILGAGTSNHKTCCALVTGSKLF